MARTPRSISLVILPHLRKTPYDPLKDLMPVSLITDATLLLALHPSVPANTVPEFIAYAKANPGKLSWGTAGAGSRSEPKRLLCPWYFGSQSLRRCQELVARRLPAGILCVCASDGARPQLGRGIQYGTARSGGLL